MAEGEQASRGSKVPTGWIVAGICLVFFVLMIVSAGNGSGSKSAPAVAAPSVPTKPTDYQRWPIEEENGFLASCAAAPRSSGIEFCRCTLNYLEANLSIEAATADFNRLARDGDKSTVSAAAVRYCSGR